MPFFVTLFRRLALDNHRNIREELNLTLSDALALDNKQFTPAVMKALIGSWWMCISDPNGEVAAAASRAFHDAIPPKKREAVLLFLAPSILKHITTMLQLSETDLSNSEAMYQVLSTIDVLSKILDWN